MVGWLIDPKDIHDRLEEEGLEGTCWLMTETKISASYQLILHGGACLSWDLVLEKIRSIFCEAVAVQPHRVIGGSLIVAVHVAAPKKTPT